MTSLPALFTNCDLFVISSQYPPPNFAGRNHFKKTKTNYTMKKGLVITMFSAFALSFALTSCTDNVVSDLSADEQLTAERRFPQAPPAGNVYLIDNDASDNHVIGFDRGADGSLSNMRTWSTGGAGTGGGLGSQSAVVRYLDYLLVVNAGSNQISAFRVNGQNLTLTDVEDSHGMMPISLTAGRNMVYVLNAGGNGNIAGWTINSTQLVSPNGYVTLDKDNGIVFTVYDFGAELGSTSGFDGIPDRMISFVSGDSTRHRVEAYSDTIVSQPRETLVVQATNRDGRSQLLMRAIATGEAQVRVQAIGGYDLAGQIDANLNILAYRSEGAWDHSRMEFNADTLALQAWTGAAEPDTGSALPDGLLVYTDGTWDPAGGEGWYANFGGTWSRITGPYPQKWGTSSNYVAIDSNGSITFTGSAYIVARYDKETQTTGFTVSKRTTRVNATGGAVTATLPTATSAAGKHFTIKKIDASGNAVTVDGDGAETIDGAATYSLATQYKSVTVASNGTSWDIIGAT